MQSSFIRGLIAGVFAMSLAATLPGGEIDYTEDFALAADRTVALKQLIPGTEDFYYYHALHYQNTEQFEKVGEILDAWIKRYNYTPRVNEIRNRQALLTYRKTPQASLEFIRQQLGLQFNHQKEVVGQKPNLPTSLDQKLISRDTLTQQANARYQNTQGFEDTALDWLVTQPLNPDRRRHLLQRLARPDHAGLAKLVADDLAYQYSQGFGSSGVHRQLLLEQLEELLKLQPALLNQQNFVQTYLAKLRPNADVDATHDAAERLAYLERLWAFVQRLDPVHNSLKANVLYHRLAFDRTQGTLDRGRFMEYVKLPRHVSYINPNFMNVEQNRRFPCDLNANFEPLTSLAIIGNDEPLVRAYLHHFFEKDTDYKAFEPYINDQYLKHNFAEVKIVRGLGEPERWYSDLPPATYQALKERIDLDFVATNKEQFAADEPVRLDLEVKNVSTLIVKVFELNTQNFYRTHLREIDTDINLDGLVANVETTHTYTEPPLRRVGRHFEFPSISRPGIYVVDFIGNGRSSRALIRKGKFRHIVRGTSSGHVFTVLDEKNQKVTNASLWLAGHEYSADKEGYIAVPYSAQPGRQPIVISAPIAPAPGQKAPVMFQSTLDYFQHDAERYELTAGIHVDRESLLTRKKAQVLIRPALFLNGNPVTLSLLENVRLMLTSTDLDGVSSSKEVGDFALHADKESVYEFQTPSRLAAITFTLRARVKNLSLNQPVEMAVQQSFAVNAIDRTEKVEDLHFSTHGGEYILDLLGKSGEPKPDRAVHFTLKHRDFRDPVNVSLQTDRNGRIVLGSLADIATVAATSPEGVAHTWPLLRDESTYYRAMHGRVGESLELPFMGRGEKPERADISLLEMRDGVFVADRFAAATIEDGMLVLSKLPRGDYDLLLKSSGSRIHLRVAAGERREGYVLSENRQLELRGDLPLQISRIDGAEKEMLVQLENVSKTTRLHVFATRYQPSFSAYANLSRVRDAEPYLITVPRNLSRYVAGRNIGDEYRYIIDRKYAKKLPGNSLERPSLLLNPWAVRKTETGQQVAQGGDDFGKQGADPNAVAARSPAPNAPPVEGGGEFANLDFLSESSLLLANLKPDDKGVVKIARELVTKHPHLHFVAVDAKQTVYRSLSGAEPPTKFNDLRLLTGLDPKEHFTQQKKISVVAGMGKFELADVTSSRFEAYDTLGRVYSLFTTLSGDAKLAEFEFVLRWPKLKPEEKRELFSKYASHELSFFLSRKDPEFFGQVVKPYLQHKKDKTFLDRWLLGDDLQSYLQPWQHAQLNVVERILLAQRINDELAWTARHVQELHDLLPPNLERQTQLFDTAIKGSALETSDALGFNKAKEAASLKRLQQNGQAFFKDAPLPTTAAGAAMAAPAPAKPGAGFFPPGAPAQDKSNYRSEALAERELQAKKSGEVMDQMRKQLGDAKAEAGRARRGAAKGDRAGEADFDDGAFENDALGRRSLARQFYQKLDKTQEWAENNYYHLLIEQQNAALVTVDPFWRDYAHHDPRQPFYSTHLAEAAGNFTEMMFALALLDLPFEAGKHDTKFEGAKMTLTAGSPLVVYHEEIRPAPGMAETPILVSQNFFRHGDRYRHENNEQIDKYVTDEFLVHTVYGCQVVITNPTSSRQKLNVLVQIPIGSLPVLGGQATKSVRIDLGPYQTHSFDFHFYFPTVGKFPHYPVHVAKNEQLIAFAAPVTLTVVEELSRVDRTSWAYISQNGTPDDVLGYLKGNNLQRTNLDKIAFRMQDKAFFQTVTALLSQRHVYHNTLWSYGIKHDVVPAVREYLQHADAFVSQCGAYLDSELLVIDPVARKSYQHLDYKPLVNARAHQLGKRRQILNDRFFGQYHQLLRVLSYRRDFQDAELMSVVYYLLLQDRIEDAQKFFGRVNSERLATRLQYDYFTAYLDFFTAEPKQAPAIAAKYANYPVDRWRNAFAAVATQLDEIAGKETQVVDKDDRTQVTTGLAATEASFDFRVESKKIHLDYQKLTAITVNYYPMDVELLFSRNPFVQGQSGQFSFIRPNLVQTLTLPAGATSHVFDLPAQFHNSNVLVEILGGGQAKSQAYYSNSLAVQVVENYGQVKVTTAGKPLSKVYVKVFARMQDGTTKFYKDGYTDLRGRFDYTSLNTNELDFVAKFAVLILSDDHGAVVREAMPPKR